jgi:indole-3-glycerol phosphate synthase
VAESGLESAQDAAGMARLGYRLALVGSALMRAPEPGRLVTAMIDAGRAASGSVS